MTIHITFSDLRQFQVLVKNIKEERRQRIIKQALIAFELGEVDTQQRKDLWDTKLS